MKRRFLIYLILPALATGLLTSCYQDLSTEATIEIPELVIEGVPETMNVLYGEELVINPVIKQEGRSAEDFEYLWTIDLVPDNYNQRLELGTDPDLRYKVSNAPSDAAYTLRLDVTDKQTGLVKVAATKLYVGSSLGEGLLVAYTRDGGATSEFDLLANKYLTYGYESDVPRYTREIHTLANGNAFGERVNAICEMVDSDGASLNENRIIIGTNSHIYSYDPLTFIQNASDGTLFYSNTQTEFGTTAIFNFAGYSHGAIIGNKAFGMLCIIDRQYSLLNFGQDPGDVFKPTNVAYGPMQQGGHLAVFDETRGKFYFIMGWNVTQASFSQVSAELGFTLAGCTSIGTGCSRNQTLCFLLRDTGGAYRACLMDVQGNTPVVRSVEIPGEEMDKITSVAFCDNCDIMYYATPQSIYATILAEGRVSTRKINWSPDSPDEKITSIKQYTQGWYGTHQYTASDYPFQLATHRLQMIITTYNETTGEGKIYLRPFNVSTGLFTSQDNGTYGGFGEITAICPTFR